MLFVREFIVIIFHNSFRIILLKNLKKFGIIF